MPAIGFRSTHPQNLTSQKSLLLIISSIFFLCQELYAQIYYGYTWPGYDLVTIDVNTSTCECEFTVVVTDPESTTNLLTFCDGELYTYGESPQGLYNIDLSNSSLSFAYPFPANAPPIGSMGQLGLACDGNGLFYLTWYNDDNSTWLYQFDSSTGILINLGLIPFRVYSDLTLYDGEIYSWTIWGLVKLDTVNAANSTLLCDTAPFVGGHTLTASPFCHSLLTCQGIIDTIYNVNLLDCSVTPLCHIAVPLVAIITEAEFDASPYCTGIIDLDCNNSSGATGSDYNAVPFTCLTQGVDIADDDISIFIDDIIETMDIELLDPKPDAPFEVLIGGSGPEISISGNGTTHITLSNNGTANIRDFEDALGSIKYVDSEPYPTEGLRTVQVYFTTIAGTLSNIAYAYIDVIELPILLVELGPDLILCDEEYAIFDAGHPGASYLWSNTSINQTITVGETGQYIVTVSDGLNCPGQDTVELEILPVIHVSLEGDTQGCDNEPDSLIIVNDAPFPITVEISSDPGSTFTFDDVMGNFLFTDIPIESTEYTIIEVIPSEPACIEIPDPIQFVEIFPTYLQTAQMSLCDGDSVLLGGSWITDAGNYPVSFKSVHFCDSIVVWTISILPSFNISIQNTTCDSAAVGLFITHLNNPTGCDTIVRTNVSLLPPDTTLIQLTSCRSSDAGVFTELLLNQLGCDSLIITTVIATAPSDTTNLNGVSCDTSSWGVFQSTLTASDGCDSLVVSTISPGIPDTTYLFSTSCDSASLGVFETHHTSTDQCDSLVISTITYSARDSTFITSASCDPTAVGVFSLTLVNSFGCDSIVTETISLLPSDATAINSTTCDPTQSGVFINTLINQFGCDSIVTETIDLLPDSETFLFSNTCLSSEAGMFVTAHFNQYGCDSIVTLTVSLIPADTTLLSFKTCDPLLVGTVQNLLTNQNGCDSLVIEVTTLYPLPDVQVQASSDFNGFAISCFGESDGSAIALASGVPTLTYIWSTGHPGQSSTGLAAGNYTVTVTDGNGCMATGAILLTEPDPFSISFLVTQPDCFAQDKGVITVEQHGGVNPIRYSIDGITFQSSPTFNGLSGGTYQLIALDANDCEDKEIIWINTPLTVNVDLGDDLVITIGDTAFIHALINIPFDSLAAISWSGLANTDCPTCLTQAVAPILTSTYAVSVTSIDGCIATDEMTVFSEKVTEVYIPNVFSPNGDGINDRFLITAGVNVKEISSMVIYDRWGDMVLSLNHFQPNDPAYAWDGIIKGKPLNPGVFAYSLIIEFKNGKSEMKSGDVTLVR